MGIFSGLFKSQKESKAAKKASKGKVIKESTLTKSQQKLEKQLSKSSAKELSKLQSLSKTKLGSQDSLYAKSKSILDDLLSNDSKAYESFKEPYMKQFQEETVPEIAERFGGAGADRSSAMQNVLGKAGSDFSSNLAQLKTGLMQNAIPTALGLGQQPLQEQMALRQSALGMSGQSLGTQGIANLYQAPRINTAGSSPGFFGSMLPAVGTAAGTAAGGPIGGAIGGAGTSYIKSLFS